MSGQSVHSLAFVIPVNAEKLCTVQLDPENTRSVSISWIGAKEPSVFLDICGMDDENHVSWKTPLLKVGDEVPTKVLADQRCDDPHMIGSSSVMDDWARSLRLTEGDSSSI